MAEIELDDRPPGIALPVTGAELAIELGFRGTGTALMGRFTVSELEQTGPPDALTIRAHAADLLAGLKAQRTRSWTAYTIGDLVGTIAGRHDLEPRVDQALQGVVPPHVDQVDESDLSLLRRLASWQLDVVTKPVDGRLLFLRRQVLANELASVATVIRHRDCRSYRVLRAEREVYAAAVARWREFEVAELEEVRAGEGEPVYVLPETCPDRASAANAAETRLRALQRGVRSGEVELARGRPKLAADAPVRLSGWGRSADGVWVARSVRHVLDGDGYRTSLQLEAVTAPWTRAPAAPRPGASFGPAPEPGQGLGGPASRTAPDMRHVVERVAALHPEALRNSCTDGEFVDRVVEALRAIDGGWGYNALSADAVAYYAGDPGAEQGRTDLAVVGVIVGRCGPNPRPAWARATQPGLWRYPRD